MRLEREARANQRVFLVSPRHSDLRASCRAQLAPDLSGASGVPLQQETLQQAHCRQLRYQEEQRPLDDAGSTLA